MIPQPPCRAVFKYEYRPLTMSYRRVPRDGGFSLTVYENNMAVFSMYELTDWGDMHAEVISRNAPRARSTQSVYRLDEEFANRYLTILKRWDSAPAISVTTDLRLSAPTTPPSRRNRWPKKAIGR